MSVSKCAALGKSSISSRAENRSEVLIRPSGSDGPSGSAKQSYLRLCSVSEPNRRGSYAGLERAYAEQAVYFGKTESRLRFGLLAHWFSGQGPALASTSTFIARSPASASLALMLGEGYVHHELALGRVTGNVPFARRILGQHDTPRGKSADVAVACFKFNLAG